MTRNLKALGLALMAVFATSAMIASAAQANPNPLHTTCAKYPCVITGEAVGNHTFETPAGTVTCTTTKFDATVEEEQSTTPTVTPTYSGCTASGLPATVTLNGCDYKLHGGVETSEHHFVEGTTEIVCPPEKTIEVHIYSTHAKHTANEPLCTVTVGPQTIGGNTFTNITGDPDHVTLVTEATVKAEIHGSKILCTGGKPATELINTTYKGTTTLKAYEDLGNHVNGAGETVYTHENQIDLTVSD